MAKNNEPKKTDDIQTTKKLLTYAGILLAAVILISLALITVYHSSSNKIYQNANDSTYYLRQINEELLSINRNVLMIISDAGKSDELADSIDKSFENIEFYKTQFSGIDGHSDRELYRYNQAVTFINAYKKKFDSRRDNLDALNTELYIQEIHPIQTTATEMFNATIDINSENTQAQLMKISVLFRAIQIFMVLLLILGELAISFVSKMLEKQNSIIKKREEELAKFQSSIAVSSRDTSKISRTNPITNLENRYGLADSAEKRNKKSNINIAIFNIDNFRYVNETYGYEYGDEVLHLIAEALVTEYRNHAEIYNYTSNAFALLFDPGMNEVAANNMAKKVLSTFSKNYTVGTIIINLTASGCFAHFEQGTMGDLNKVLLKMESVIRTIKDNGGNKIEKLD